MKTTPTQNKQARSLVERIIIIIERFLSWHATVRARKHARMMHKHVIIQWLHAFIWAIFWVFIINQYFFQIYGIPSGSMQPTLEIGDRIIVDKLTFGPEILPNYKKIQNFSEPQRANLISFKNPTYLEQSTIREIVTTIVYMFSLGNINLKVDKNGKPQATPLIKRAIGVGGDRIINYHGNLLIKPRGSHLQPEAQLIKKHALNYAPYRHISQEYYQKLRILTQQNVLAEHNVPQTLAPNQQQIANTSITFHDPITARYLYTYYTFLLNPTKKSLMRTIAHNEFGWYVPPQHIMTIGDNRDNSHDARYFGPVPFSLLSGKALVTIYPFSRYRSLT